MDVQTEYQLWLDNVTAEERAELEGLPMQECKERFYSALEFGTAGMRGILRVGCNGMNSYTVGRATLGLARYMLKESAQTQGVVVSFDSRHKSTEFAHLTAQILAHFGIQVYLCDGLRPVPLLSFAVRYYKAFAGVMVTASHNPKEYNGYKVYGADGAQLSLAPAQAMLQIIEQESYFNIPCADFDQAVANGKIRIVGKELDDAYMAAVLPQINGIGEIPCRDIKIVYTPIHGSGCKPVMRAFNEMGLTGVELLDSQAAPDGDFPTVISPNPENMETLSLAIARAKQTGAQLVIGTDPDCDRMGVAVRNAAGQFIPLTGNQAGCLMLYGLLEARKKLGLLPSNGVVIKTIVTSELVRPIAAAYGAQTVEVLTGFKFIGEKIKEYEETGQYEYLFGFEESFGYLLGTHARDKDGVVACMLLARTACDLAAQGKTLLDGLEDIYARFGCYLEKTLSFTLSGMDGMQKISGTMARLAEEKIDAFGDNSVLAMRNYNSSVRTLQNGTITPITLPKSNVLYYELDNGWACVRPSGTEPKLKVYMGVSGQCKTCAQAALDALEAAVCSVVGL